MRARQKGRETGTSDVTSGRAPMVLSNGLKRGAEYPATKYADAVTGEGKPKLIENPYVVGNP